MYTVFADQHHLSLYNSLRLLFEERLGGTLYRPIGKSWHEKGYWRMAEIYNNHPATIEQYLGINPGYTPPDGSQPLNRVQKIEEDVYYIWDPEYQYFHQAITLEKFLNTKIDIVIASLPQHIESFQRLCDAHSNHPKLIYQVGNAWTVSEGYAKNIMASSRITTPAGTNHITYHQEFNTRIFQPATVDPYRKISAFINCFNTAGHYVHDWQLFLDVERMMPEWTFKSYGGSCRDGAAHGAAALADCMQNARFVWHTKAGGDGYGHIIYNSAAVGRPAIVKKEYYAGKMAEELMIDGVTCIAVDGMSPNQIVEKIKYYSEPERYIPMCKNVYDNFKKHVDFNREEQMIRTFLLNLI